MRKPKKIIRIQGSGDSNQLNTNPWQSKDVRYQYTDEDYTTNVVAGGLGLKAAVFMEDCKEASNEGRLARIRKENRELNSLARSSFSAVPALRALARFSDLLKGTIREDSVVRYDVNPSLQYQRTLLECARLWDEVGSGEETSFVFNSSFADGVGIEHGRQKFFSYSGENKGINAGVYRTKYLELKSIERSLAKFTGALANNTLAHLSSAEASLFAMNFISNIHNFSRYGVEVGIYMNMIEDALVSNDEYLNSMGALLDRCYLYARDSRLAITETLPKYDVLKADNALKNHYDSVVMPVFNEYLSGYFTSYNENQAMGLYSEIFERMGSIELLDDKSITAKRLVSSVVVLDAKLERIELLLRSYLHALAESITNPQTISSIVAKPLIALRSEVGISEVISKVDSRLGMNFEYVGKNLRSMDAVY